VGDGSGGGINSPSIPDIEDDVLGPVGLPPSLCDLVLIPDSLNIRGEWKAVVLGPNEEVLVSGGRDGDDWGRVRVVWNGDGSLWSVTWGSGRGDRSSTTVTVFIVTAGSRAVASKESGVFVAPDTFSILMSGLLSPSIDRPVAGEGGGGMNKGGGEFSWSGEGVVPVDLPW
jgi:hypothetical protein